MARVQTRGTVRGFTLIELMVAIAIVAILAAIAFPSFQYTIRSSRVATTTNQLIAAVALARTEAIRSTRGGGVCVSGDGASCGTGTNWNSGWMVWADRNGNGTFDSGEELRYMQGNPKLVVGGPAAVLQFDSRGRLNSVQQFSIQPDACDGKALRRVLALGPTGQVRKSGDLQSCG
ncbi:MAG TPA: GspH/FimT family pseudopilin [Lysobacter sp.]|nr:GspH/FimT family pseudopilin [Lysobacter sp.]